MRSVATLFVLATVLVGTGAHAIYDPTWERPIYTSHMVETDAFLREIRSDSTNIEVTLHQRDGQVEPTQISFKADQQVYCVTWPCYPIKHHFIYQVTEVRPAGCGSKKILGQSVIRGPFGRAQIRSIRIVDHSERRCKDLKPFTWEVTTQNPLGQRRYFGGEPEGVVSIQSVEGN